jgi:antibiotic biosynthesis monooxygenase (ABM) superfamily enzyme
MSKPVFNIVATECKPEVEEKFNKWYDEVHVPMLKKFKRMKSVKRCRALQEGTNYPTYLAIYEFENAKDLAAFRNSPEMAAARDEMKETWKDGGWEIKWAAPYQLHKEWE